jgi:uncharacterized membrane protein YidH (DUF202 family)
VRCGGRRHADGVSQDFLPWRAYRTVLWLAVAGAAYATIVAGWLYLPGYRPVPTPVWSAAFVPVLPVYGAAILFARRYWRQGPTLARRRPMEHVRPDPVIVVRALLAVLVALIVVVLVMTARARVGSPLPRAEPVIVNGRYMLASHGSLTPVSRELYLRATEEDQQPLAAFATVFYLAAGLIVAMTGERLAANPRSRPSRRG